MKPTRLPMPGTDEARERGCTCPWQGREPPPWMVDGDCPLHGYGAEADGSEPTIAARPSKELAT
jgi:hypothetical protein